MARDIEASVQLASKVWLHSFILGERRIESLLSAASATSESLDGSRADVGYPPALLLALGLRRDAFEEQCRACLELGWVGARMAAQQRAAYARAAAEGLQALNAIVQVGMRTSNALEADALEPERTDAGPGRRARRKPALRAALAPSAQVPNSGRAAAAPMGDGTVAASPVRSTKKPRPSVVLRSVSVVPASDRRVIDDQLPPPGSLPDVHVSVARGGRKE